MKRIAIIGAGISGLSATHELEQSRQRGAPLEYVLYEANPRPGGVLLTEDIDGFTVEAGPDSFLTEKSWAIDFCHQLGLGDQLINSNDAQRKTYILVDGRLVALPDGLAFLVPTKVLPALLTPLFSAGTKFRMGREWFYSKRVSEEDESVAEFVTRHYGVEMVECLADPLLAGVYGGEASQLSVRAVLPRFVEMEAQYGSLGRGIIASRRKTAQSNKGSARPLFTSLRGGMHQLVDALVAAIPKWAIQVNSRIRSVELRDNGWLVSSEGKAEQFNGVILATPAYRAAEMLHNSAQELANELREINYSSSVIVALGFGNDVCAALPSGFGFLVPRKEGKQILATTFVHAKFSHRAPQEHALIRCFLGGTTAAQNTTLPDNEIVRLARDELRQVLGLTASPLFSRVYRWPLAMAQYSVGHLQRLAHIERLLHQAQGLALAGNAYHGIGVPDCIRSGQNAARQLLKQLET
jgi:oxygen-dependent protoporphyrinogen oxidase